MSVREGAVRSKTCAFCSMAVQDDGLVCRQCGFEFGTQWQPPAGEEEAPFAPGLRTCSCCGVRNPVGRDFCSECNAPVGDYSSIKPLERIWAIGFLYRRASENHLHLSGAAGVGRTWLAIMLLLYSAIFFGTFLQEGRNIFFAMLFGGGVPESSLVLSLVLTVFMLPVAAAGYLGLRLLGVRFEIPKERSDAPRALR
jgi:hypothetical protein